MRSIARYLGLLTLLITSSVYALSYPITTPTGETTGGTYRLYFDNIFSSETLCDGANMVVGGFNNIGQPICVTPVSTGLYVTGQTLGDTLRFDGSAWVRNNLIYNDGTSIGIADQTPSYLLDVGGTANFLGLRLPTGAASGYVLTSDPSGVARWTDTPAISLSGIVGGTEYIVPKFGPSGTGLVLSSIYDNGVTVGINTVVPSASYKLDIAGGDARINGIRYGVGGGNLTSNVAIGLNAFSTNVTSPNNVIIGNLAGSTLTAGAGGNILIGNGVVTSTSTASNELNIGNWIYGSNGNIGIGTGGGLTTRLRVDGQIQITGGSPGAGLYLQSDASGIAYWTGVTASSVTASGIVGGTEYYLSRFGPSGNGLFASVLYESGGLIGLNTTNPSVQFDVNGTIRVRSGGTLGYVLTSDSNGVASWQAPGVSMNTWNIIGNAGTTAATHFLGTTDLMDLVFRTNNTERMRVLSGGFVGIGTATPGAALEVAGQVKITGGTPGAGKFLVSDASGLATWQNTSSTLSGTYWSLSGNTIGANDFIGTLNNQDLRLRVNNVQIGRFYTSGSVNIGTGNSLSSPANTYVLGSSNTITGSNISVIGYGNNIANSAYDGLVIGNNNTMTAGGWPIIVGRNNSSLSTYDEPTIFGSNNQATYHDVVLLGLTNSGGGESNQPSLAVGAYNQAGDNFIGYREETIAVGVGNRVLNQYSSAFGRRNTVSSSYSSAFGANITNNIAGSTMIGPNNTAKVTIFTGGQVAIGTSTITTGALLKVAGQIQITGGSPGSGRILVSDATGLATWGNGFSGATTATGVYGSSGNYISYFGSGGVGLYPTILYYTGGRVGINTTNPQYTLDVLGNSGIVRASSGFCLGMTATGCLSDWSDLNNIVKSSGTPHYIAKFSNTGLIGNSQLYETGGQLWIGDISGIIGGGATKGYITIEANGSTNSSNPFLTLSENGGQECRMWINGANKLGSNCAWTAGLGSTFNPYQLIMANSAGTDFSGTIMYNTTTGVGVGIQSPSTNFHVSGSTLVTGDLTVQGKVITDTIVNRSVNNVSISGSILPDTAAPLTYRDIGSNTTRWNNLYLSGQITIGGGSPALGRMLISDANGLASWTGVITATNLNLAGAVTGSTIFYNSGAWRIGTGMFNNGTYVGIGTSSPGQRLTVSGGTIQLINGTQGNGRMLISDSNGVASWTGVITATALNIPGSVLGATLYNNGSSWVAGTGIYNTGGNIGIGSNSPTAKLTIDSGVNNLAGVRISRIGAATPVFTGTAAPLGVDGSGNVVVAQQGAIPVYTALGASPSSAPNSTVNPPTIGADYDRYFSINARQSFTVTDVGGNPHNCPEFNLGTTNKGITGCSQTPWASYVMTAQNATSGDRYAYQILISDRTDAPFVVRGGMYDESDGDLENTAMTIPALWFKALTVPTNRSNWLYVNPGVDQNNNPISGGGNVGVGTMTPSSRFEIWNLNSGGTGSNSLMHFQGTNNLGIGSGSVRIGLTGNANIGYGHESLYTLTNGYSNTAVGYRAMRLTTGGFNNSALGQDSLYNNAGGSWNLALGYAAAYSNTSGTGNIAVGPRSMYNNSTGLNNIAIGYEALRGIGGSSTTNNIAIGVNALSGTTGNNNIAIGVEAGTTQRSGTNNIAIGYDAEVFSPTGSNQLSIGNWIYGSGGNIGIGTTNSTAKLEVAGQIKITGGSPGAGKVLTSDATGLATWQTPSGSGGGGGGGGAGWELTGNAGTVAGTNYIGTSDAVDFVIGTNGTEKMRVESGGDVGIGTNNPASKLDVRGTVRLGTNGTQFNAIIRATVNDNVPSLSNGSCSLRTYAVTNAQTTGSVIISPSATLNNRIQFSYARVASAGNVEAKICNENTSGGAIDLPAMDYYITVIQ